MLCRVVAQHLTDNCNKASAYGGRGLIWKLYGHALCALYLFVKLLYFLNVLIQLVLVTIILAWRSPVQSPVTDPE